MFRIRSWEECKAANEENNSSNTRILPWTCQTPQTMEPEQCCVAVSSVVMSWRWDSLQSGAPMQIPLTPKVSCWKAQLSEEQFYCLLPPLLQIQDQSQSQTSNCNSSTVFSSPLLWSSTTRGINFLSDTASAVCRNSQQQTKVQHWKNSKMADRQDGWVCRSDKQSRFLSMSSGSSELHFQ